MDKETIKHVVKILISDEVVIRNWTKLYDSLSLEGDLVGLRIQFKSGTITDYELFMNILTQWVSVTGDGATLNSLSQTLEDNQFKNISREFILFKY